MKEIIKQEKEFNGFRMNGFIMLLVHLIIIPAIIALVAYFSVSVAVIAITSAVLGLFWFISLFGYMQLEPNEARVMVFFGKYDGTFNNTGFFWVNPFFTKKKLFWRS
mgnify:FL=1